LKGKYILINEKEEEEKHWTKLERGRMHIGDKLWVKLF
jgi:hypothetical protein